MTHAHRRVAIIGAGFSGTVVAAHLLRHHGPEPLHLIQINRSGRLARGVAYGTRSSEHVLNVPAGRMSAFPEDEDDFLRFARQRDPSVTGGTFVPRRLYGDYLEHLLLSAQAASRRGTVLEQRADEVSELTPLPDRQGVRVTVRHGAPFDVAAVVMAVGNYAPAHPPVADDACIEWSGYVRDPWAHNALARVPRDVPVLLFGTGLTMVDAALTLLAHERQAPLVAISRRGLLPQPHRSHTAPPSYSHLPPELLGTSPSAVAYLRATRRHVRRLAAQGIDWREVVASLRPVTPRLWESLDVVERRRFLRHLRPHWDAHRHRMAPALWERVQAALSEERLRIVAGRLLGVRTEGAMAHVRIRRRGSSVEESLAVGAIVNCSGPDPDVRAIDDPLLRNLLSSGVAVADEIGLGLEVTDDYRLIGRSGQPSDSIFLTGPLLKGKYWEATAVPELRVHAARVAARVISVVRRERAPAVA